MEEARIEHIEYSTYLTHLMLMRLCDPRAQGISLVSDRLSSFRRTTTAKRGARVQFFPQFNRFYMCVYACLFDNRQLRRPVRGQYGDSFVFRSQV